VPPEAAAGDWLVSVLTAAARDVFEGRTIRVLTAMSARASMVVPAVSGTTTRCANRARMLSVAELAARRIR
jgi:hypothetical protein